MKVRMPRKRVVVVVATAMALAMGGGVAYAYWSASGTGVGTAATGDTTDFTFIDVTPNATGLTPGGPAEDVTFTVHNPGTGSQNLVAVAVTVADASGTPWGTGSTPAAPTGCSADDYAVGPVTIVPGEIVGGGDLSGSVSMSMNNLGTNQDSCKGAIVTIAYASS